MNAIGSKLGIVATKKLPGEPRTLSGLAAAHPEADPDNVRHTLILLEQPPLDRLQRSLIRGRATALRCGL